jgi:hypothetical protein
MCGLVKFATLTFGGLVVWTTACREPDGVSKPQAQAIPELAAKELALRRYRELFSDKFLRNPVDERYYPFPELAVADINQVEKQDTFWVVRVAPPSGVALEAHVDRAGQWVELRRVTFSPE